MTSFINLVYLSPVAVDMINFPLTLNNVHLSIVYFPEPGWASESCSSVPLPESNIK